MAVFLNDDRPQISLRQPNIRPTPAGHRPGTSPIPACFAHRLTSQRLISPPSGPSAPHSTDLIPTPDIFCACALCMNFRSLKKSKNTASVHRHKSVFVSTPPAQVSTHPCPPAPRVAPPLPAVSAPAARSPHGKRPTDLHKDPPPGRLQQCRPSSAQRTRLSPFSGAHVLYR